MNPQGSVADRDNPRAQGADGRPPVVFLMGPTASGKTELAVALAQALPCDIVSVDSAMVYRGMDIGSAKPGPAVLARAPHRLIDIRDPAEPYSAAAFAADAAVEIDAIHSRGRIPLLVGGTMLYFRALEQGLAALPAADAAIRARLTAEAARNGWPALHARLATADRAAAAAIHPNDGQRIQRALEVLALTGAGPSHWYARATTPARPWRAIKLALAPASRLALHERLQLRFHSMLQAGLLAELEKLHARPDVSLDTPALRAVGYRQLWRHLDGEWPLEEAVRRAVIASRQLAKRQLTWLRREANLTWLESEQAGLARTALEQLQQRLAGWPGSA